MSEFVTDETESQQIVIHHRDADGALKPLAVIRSDGHVEYEGDPLPVARLFWGVLRTSEMTQPLMERLDGLIDAHAGVASNGGWTGRRVAADHRGLRITDVRILDLQPSGISIRVAGVSVPQTLDLTERDLAFYEALRTAYLELSACRPAGRG